MPKYGWYVVTRLDDITRIANDPGTFSNRMFVTVPEVPARFRDRLPNGFPMKVQLAAADPPAHGRLKRFMQAALSPRTIAAHADQIGQIAHRLVDEMLRSPDRQANLVATRSEEQTSELQSLMRISYAVFCLKKKNIILSKNEISFL